MGWVSLAVVVTAITVVAAVAHVLAGRGPTHRPVLNRLWRLCRCYVRWMHQPLVVGAEHVPLTGGVLLVANHTSAVDPSLIQAFVPRLIHWLMARDMMIGPMSRLWRTIEVIPVNRNGVDRTSARTAIRLLEAGEVVGIFPQGGIATPTEGERLFHPGVGLIARRSGAVIVPIHVSGTPRTRRAFAALFRRSRSCVAFGPPITLEQLQYADDAQLAEQLRLRVADAGRVFTSSEG